MQLLIIDVQNIYRSHCHGLIKPIPKFSKNFSELLYLYDNTSGEEFYEEIPEEWMENEEFYDRLNSFSKQYSFFRGLMDAGVDEDDDALVQLARFLIKNNIVDCQDIFTEPEILEKYQIEFKNSPLQNIRLRDYSFYVPEDLIEEIQNRIKPGVTLIGGGRNKCLKEVALLLRVLDIEYHIHEELTY